MKKTPPRLKRRLDALIKRANWPTYVQFVAELSNRGFKVVSHPGSASRLEMVAIQAAKTSSALQAAAILDRHQANPSIGVLPRIQARLGLAIRWIRGQE